MVTGRIVMIARRTIQVGCACTAMLLLAITAAGQSVDAQALVAPLRQGGLVIVMRHASSPRDVPTAATATAGNAKLERQLDEAGRNAAAAMGLPNGPKGAIP